MFEVGKRYAFKILEAGEETSFGGTVEKYEHPLLKLADRPGIQAHTARSPTRVYGMILNVTSPNFISAQQASNQETDEAFLQRLADAEKNKAE